MSEIFYYNGHWSESEPKVLGPLDQAFWMGSAVFDGARAFDGLVPDLDKHCQRLIESAEKMNLSPKQNAKEIEALCLEGVSKLPRNEDYYIRPMFYPVDGAVVPDPASTTFILAIYEWTMSETPTFTACRSSYRRPAKDMAPADAKACCLYPNVVRAKLEANRRGYDSGIVLDANGNVAEFETSNLFLVKDGEVHTPILNGTFLNGITRQRIMQLLQNDGYIVRERSIPYEEILSADELFSTGNLEKVIYCTQVEGAPEKGIGPISKRARELYFEFAESTRSN